MNKTVYVEKKNLFNVEAKQLLNDFKFNLEIQEITNVRLLNKYIVVNIDDKTYQKSLLSVFSEPPTDNLYEEKFPIKKTDSVFAVAYLPGQFDQRSDSAEQCIKLINPQSKVIVRTAIIVILEGKLTKEQIDKIRKYFINPTDSQEVNPYAREYKTENTPPKKVEIINDFIKWSNEDINAFHHDNGLSMSIEDLLLVQTYFKSENRNPTITEIKVIDTYWSDHCRHTTFETQLEEIDIEDSLYTDPIKLAFKAYIRSRKNLYGKDTNRKISLMDMATIVAKELRKQGKLEALDISDENNACSINVDVNIDGTNEKYLLMFKNETHNHPTEIEPFGGAATCLGGAIRDPLSGRTYVYQAMRVTGSADPTVSIDKTLPNKLPQRIITLGAAKGYSSYGNQIGLATGQVDEVYHPNYVAKRMEIGAVIGCAPKQNVVRKTPTPGDAIILLGGRTGKDGIGGATGSSKAHRKESITESGAEVQKGNPICERKIQRLFKNPDATRLIKKCNDFGAGGVCVAIGELCPGIDINLNAIPKKYDGLNGTELAISESQERMAVVIASKDVKHFMQLVKDENLEAIVVAEVTNTKRLKMFWNKQIIVDISREFLDMNGAQQHANIVVKAPDSSPFVINKNKTFKQLFDEMLDSLNTCVKLGLIQRFDSTIGANTVLMPLGGKYQLTPAEGMAALIPTFNKPGSTASLMSYGFNPYIGAWSPFHMAYYSVIESITKIVAMGGEWRKIYLTFQEYFERLNKNPEAWGKPFAALLGAYTVQQAFGLAAIGGKDSMSGTFENINVSPTLVSFAVATSEANTITSPEFKKTNSHIVLLLPTSNDDMTTNIRVLKKNFDIVHKGIINKQILSAYSLKQFGVAEGLVKMSIGNHIGLEFNNISLQELFGVNYGGLIIEVDEKCYIKKLLSDTNYKVIGSTNDSGFLTSTQYDCSEAIKSLAEKITSKLRNIFISETNITSQNVELPIYKNTKVVFSKIKIAKPLVVIPVFPGTNCEFDSQRAFEQAGAKVEQILILNQDAKSLLESINKLAKAIDKANIIMIPGGFSAADEPDGSAKFIVNVFKNKKIKDAVTNLLEKRDGLIIGICNGFQALIKLGLLPYGKIMDVDKQSPTLTFNEIHHHMSGLIRTKIISNKSPWLFGAKLGGVYTIPISHGEGKFVASEQQIQELSKNGQIATQYVDMNNNPTMNMPHNPNGSIYAIEGITSSDGRIFGKMGHSERVGEYLYKNVIGNYEQKIFESGVKYFTHKK